MTEYVNEILSILDRVQGLSDAGLTCALCIVAGYGLRFIPEKWIPNRSIPALVILLGGVLFACIADPKVATIPFRVWLTRNIAVGCIVGFIAWMIHYWALSYLEKYLSNKFGSKPLEDSAAQPPTVK